MTYRTRRVHTQEQSTMRQGSHLRVWGRPKKRILWKRLLLVLSVGLFCLLLLGYYGLRSYLPHSASASVLIPNAFYMPQAGFVSTISSSNIRGLKPGERDEALQQKLENALRALPTSLKPYVYIQDLKSNRWAGYKSTISVPAASVIKLPLLLLALRQLDAGTVSLNTHLFAEPYFQAEGSGYTQYMSPYKAFLFQDVLRLMIQVSDNTATNLVINQLGGVESVNAQLHALGLEQTHLNNWLPDIAGTNVVSMRDMAETLEQLLHSAVLSPQSQAMAQRILEGTHNRSLLPFLLPSGTKIAHKTGHIGKSVGNSGFITLPDGHQYTVCVQLERPAGDHQSEKFIQDLSKLVYDQMVENKEG
jgi:beta-lactamase class A